MKAVLLKDLLRDHRITRVEVTAEGWFIKFKDGPWLQLYVDEMGKAHRYVLPPNQYVDIR